jgi:predicted transcriptional regulator
MDTASRPDDGTQAARPETDAEQQRRLACEAEMIAEARAELDAGLYATSAEVKAWIDSIGTDHELPVPYPRHPRP